MLYILVQTLKKDKNVPFQRCKNAMSKIRINLNEHLSIMITQLQSSFWWRCRDIVIIVIVKCLYL